MAINPQVSALFSVLGISANPNQITGLNTQALETLVGGAGSDYILGQAGLLDTLNGNGGNDYLEGGAGIDAINGGAGIDTAGYANASTGVSVLMTVGGAGAATGGDGLADTLTGIENVVGSNFNDTIRGDNLANVLAGLDGVDNIHGQAGNDTLIGGAGNDLLYGDAGDDILRGGAGADQLFGGDGTDTADYSTSTGGIFVEMGISNSGGDAQGDILTNIQNITGGSGNDHIIGDSQSNVLRGGAGNDILVGRSDEFASGGNDLIIGGAGADGIDVGEQFPFGSTDFIQFLNVSDSTPGSFDTITLDSADGVDLSPIDANPFIDGNQAFTKIDGEFTEVVGQLRDGGTYIEADTTGDGVADFYFEYSGIGLNGMQNLTL